MDKKKYRIELDFGFEIELEIKQDEETKAILHEINNFWMGAKERLRDSNNCIATVVCKLIAVEVIRLQCSNAFYESTKSVIDAFDKGIEGFYKLNGTDGLTLISIGCPFDARDLELTVVEIDD